MNSSRRHLRLALPFDLIETPNVLHLIWGEDIRYALRGPSIESWGSALLRRCDGNVSIGEALASVPDPFRKTAESLVENLLGERVLVEELPEKSPERLDFSVKIHGSGDLADLLEDSLGVAFPSVESHPELHVLCEATLDETRALAFNRERLGDGECWLWVSSGPRSRGYVSPLFLPWRGPCFGCLIAAFDRRSPAREVRSALREHTASGGSLAESMTSKASLGILSELVRFKVEAARQVEVPGALHRLHVVEFETFEVSTHAVAVDIDCEVGCYPPRNGPRASL